QLFGWAMAVARIAGWPAAMGELPVKLAGLLVKRTWAERARVDPAGMRHLGVIAGRKNFVGRGDLIPAHGFFNDRDAMLTKQPDHALPGDAVQKRTVGNGRI